MNLTRAWKSTGAFFALALMTVAWGGGTQDNTLTAIGNKTACPGDTITFTTTAGGPTPYKFTWQKNGVAIASQTNNSLTLPHVALSDAAKYTVILKGGSTSVTNSGTLTVTTGVTATALPNLLRYVGSIAVFKTTPSGTGPFIFTWKKNGTTINGQTGNSLTLTNLTQADSGTYSVIVSGACGNPVTVTGTLTVDTCFPAVDVMLVIDRSGSMTGKPYFDALAACSNFVQNLHYTNGDQAGLASYNSAATLDQTLTNKLSKLDQSIDAIPDATGFTSVSLGLQTGQNELESVRHHADSLPVLVLLSDGMPTGGDTSSNALYWAAQAKNDGTRIFTVGLGSVNAALLKGIASSTNDYYFTTNSAQLTALFNAVSTVICRPPTNIVVAGLANQVVCAGSTANFAVTVTGCDSYRYQWIKDGVALNGKTNSVLTLNTVAGTDAGIYSVAVLSGCQNVTNSATLTVNASTVVSVPPANATNCPGLPASFHVSATGTSLTYQWFKGASVLSGQTNSTLTLNSTSATDAGTYNVVVSGVCGLPVTNSATLVVNSNAVVTVPPADTTICVGGAANFAVNATGTGLTYQWYKGTTLLTGKTGSTLTLNGVSPTDAATYSVVVSGVCGNSVTNSAKLFVNANTLIVTPPVNATNCPGTTANFSVNATGTGLTYQWYKGTSSLGQTTSTLTLNNVSATDAGLYSVVVSGACGIPVTNSATLFVNANVVVATAPMNATNCPGTTANFSMNANGTGLTYQWFKGASLLGQTTSTLTLNNVSATDAGLYSVVVSGACGIPVTNSATLFVDESVVVTTAPANATNCPGTTVNFSVSATGTGVRFNWFKGTALLINRTNAVLTLNNVTAADAGVYSVLVAGACGGGFITNSATLVINTNALIATPPSSTTNCPGTTANFSVNAIGTGLTYQWYKGASLLNGQTTPVLTLPNVTALDAGSYRVVVGGICGAPVTNSATLTVNSNAVMTIPPSNSTNCPGTTANFSAGAGGTSLTFQWYKGTTLLVDQTGPVLTITNVSFADAGVYSVIAGGVCGVPATNSAMLVINTNALVTTPPSSATNCPGTTANFSVNAVGSGLTYQWYAGTNSLDNETNSLLTLTNVSAAEAGTYSIVVSGVCGAPLTNSATLTVNSNLVVTVPPANTTNCPGATVNFSVNATGTGLAYQWYKETSILPGQTNSMLTLNNVGVTQGGLYRVVIGGTCGASVTNSATLVIYANTVVLTPPANVTTCPGTAANFSVDARGNDLTYQWYKGTTLLNGKTASVLTLNNVSVADAGTYSVIVSGTCGTPVTNSATLSVNANVVITVPPANSTNCPGTAANFSVNANGTGLTYQWYKGTVIFGGFTGSTFTLIDVGPKDAGIYSVVVTGACGTPVTNSAMLIVNSNAVVTVPPSNATNCPGTTANFSVNASGTHLSYQWYKDTALLNGQTGSTLILSNVTSANAGSYRVIVSGDCGTPVTNNASLFVNIATAITNSLSNATNCPGTRAFFAIGANGTGLTFKWYKGASLLNNQAGPILELDNVTAADAGVYSIVINGACGTAITNSATLVVNTNALIVTPPSNATNCPGTTANFSVNAAGTGLTYQWYKGAALLSGKTASILTLSNVSGNDAGSYSVVVSGICGTPMTNSATLVVNQNVSVAPLAGVTNNIGGGATFTAVVSGTGPFSYQWFKGGTALTGKTNNSLTLNNLQPGDSGTYSVSVTGACGQAATSAAVLTINLPPVVSITYPTNGTVFVEPATFTILAAASDPDGVVTNVEFFYSTNGVDFVFMGQTNGSPYLTIASNLPAAHYTFMARATDNLGAMGVSLPVSVTVVPVEPPGVTVIGNLTLNTQDGFQWLTNVVCNPLYSHANALRIDIHNITNSSIRVVNAAGTNNGVPFVISSGAINPGTCWTNVIKFYDPLQLAFYPVLTVQLVDPLGVGEPDGTPQAIFSGKYLRDGTFLVEFTTVPGVTYYIQYSSDMVHWKTVFPPFAGTGQRTQWIDSGPPGTESFPSINTTRFYRVLLAH